MHKNVLTAEECLEVGLPLPVCELRSEMRITGQCMGLCDEEYDLDEDLVSTRPDMLLRESKVHREVWLCGNCWDAESVCEEDCSEEEE